MIKCDPRAFAKCRYHKYCFGAAEFAKGSKCDKFNKKILEQPMTNADRIRAMSDEELLDFMIKTIGNAYMCKILRTEPMFCTLEWLRQPAEED